MKHKNFNQAIVDGQVYVQSDFLDALDRKSEEAQTSQQTLPQPEAQKTDSSQSTKKVLPKNQQMGFREDYNEAVIMLYIISSLYKGTKEEEPEELKKLEENAKKTKARYERYNPKAKQNIIDYGRDVVDACMSPDNDFLCALRKRAENAKHPHALWHMFAYAQTSVYQVAAIIRDHNSKA